MAGFDINSIKGNDRYIAGGGVVVLIASFLPWYGASFGGFSSSVSGWSAGAWAVLGILLCIAAAGYVVARSMGQLDDLTLPIGPALLVLGLAGLGALFFLIRWLTLPSGGSAGFNYGPRIGLFLGLAAALAQAAFAGMSFRSSGEKLPGQS